MCLMCLVDAPLSSLPVARLRQAEVDAAHAEAAHQPATPRSRFGYSGTSPPAAHSASSPSPGGFGGGSSSGLLDVRIGSPLAPANAAAVQHVVASIAASALDPLSEARLRAVADDPRAQLMTTPRVGGGGALGSPEAVVRCFGGGLHFVGEMA